MQLDFYEKKAHFFKVLANPLRLQILHILYEEGALSGKQIKEKMHLPQSTTSNYLSKLVDAGCLMVEKKGLENAYSMKDEVMRAFIELTLEDEKIS